MSWKRMNNRERGSYLIGEAIMRHLEDESRPAEDDALAGIARMVALRLTEEERLLLREETGWTIGLKSPEEEEDRRVIPFPSRDDIPF